MRGSSSEREVGKTEQHQKTKITGRPAEKRRLSKHGKKEKVRKERSTEILREGMGWDGGGDEMRWSPRM
jgi:hypothetical protein